MPLTPLRLCLLALAAVAAPAAAQRAQPAISQPLLEAPVAVRQQALASGEVTGQASVAVPPGEAPVTVRSIQPDSVRRADYRIVFAELDTDGDGFISAEEAQAHPPLADEFKALDTQRRGRLGRGELAGWLVD